MELIFFVFILLLIFGTSLVSCTMDNRSKLKPYLVCFECLILCLVSMAFYENTAGPKAIDVYKGRTQLEVVKTYEDSILVRVDSLVTLKRIK